MSALVFLAKLADELRYCQRHFLAIREAKAAELTSLLWEHAEHMDWLVLNVRIEADGGYSLWLADGGWA